MNIPKTELKLFDEELNGILERTLKLISVQKTEAITGAATANIKFKRLAQVSEQMVWYLRTYIWAEEIEDLEETISLKYPINWFEHLKCQIYNCFPEWFIDGLKDKFPVKYTTLSKNCRLKTVAKYPEFDYVPLPEDKYGPCRLQTMNWSSEVQKDESK